MYGSGQNKWKEQVSGIVLLAVVLVILLGYFYSPQSTVIVPLGTVYPLKAGNHRAISFILNRDVRVNGMFSATNGASFYIMSSNQFESFSSTGQVSTYLFTTGRVTRGPITTNIARSSNSPYYFVFKNDNTPFESTVTILQAITIT